VWTVVAADAAVWLAGAGVAPAVLAAITPPVMTAAAAMTAGTPRERPFERWDRVVRKERKELTSVGGRSRRLTFRKCLNLSNA
jgi:hypothetical protein